MSQALCKDGICYLLDRSNGLTAFELATGKILWQDAQITAVTETHRPVGME